MTITNKMLAAMYGVCDMYTQFIELIGRGVSCMTAYHFSCVAPFASLFFIIGVVIFVCEWKGWF